MNLFDIMDPETGVLIESDWNLKMKQQRVKFTDVARVLIESDWNLKVIAEINETEGTGINRIRLEFKVL